MDIRLLFKKNRLIRFDENGKISFAAGRPGSTIKVWASFSLKSVGVMVNLEDVANFKIVLDDFFLSSIDQYDSSCPIPILCPPVDMDVWREWAAKHNASLIVLPPNSYDLNPCDVLWRKIYKHVLSEISYKFVCKKQLWEEVATAFDFFTMHHLVQFPAALSMRERMEQLERAAGGPVFP